MGPIDDMWFERNSNLNNAQPKNQKQPDMVLRDVYDNKKQEALEK